MTGDPKAAAVHRLGEGVRLRTGIKIGPQTEAKLLRIFGSMAPELLLAWVSEIERLPHDHPEWLAVIENLTVHESFFFRDRPQLDVVRHHLLPQLIAGAARGDRRLRLWSAGCASGEEPYTLAILVLEAMRELGEATGTPETGIRPLPGWSVSVLGTDISRPVLELARQGIYHSGELSALRALPREHEGWFEPMRLPDHTEEGRQVRSHLKPFVNFQPFNLLDKHPPASDFQIVLCRNVFIYFAPDAQLSAQRTFAAALEPEGVLMMGPTDRLEATEHFTAKWVRDTVVYHRRRQEHL